MLILNAMFSAISVSQVPEHKMVEVNISGVCSFIGTEIGSIAKNEKNEKNEK